MGVESGFNFSKPSSLPTSWQEQIKYAQNKNSLSTKSNNSDQLYLQGYNYKGTIDSQAKIAEVIDELFSDEAVTVEYTDISTFEIVTLKAIRQKAKELSIEDPLLSLRAQLDTLIQVGMELIEIEWLYKGTTFYSTAIVSNEHGGFLYDHIGFRVLGTEREEAKAKEIELNIPSTKTSSEFEVATIRRFNKPGSIPNFYGMIVIRYHITCSSSFNAHGILCDRTLNATHYAAPGFSCAADIKTVSGEIGTSKFHEFAWGYAYGSGITVSLGWNGTGFSISPSAQGSTGAQVHKP